MKTFMGSALIMVVVLAFAPAAPAEEFAFTDYSFVWHAAKEGNVALAVIKDPQGVRFELGSLGGRVATVTLSGAQAAEVGGILVKADEYYEKHQNYYAANRETSKPAYNREISDVVETGDHRVIFYSAPTGSEFVVKVGKAKTFTTMALLSRQEAMAMGRQMVKAKEMEAFVDRHLKF